MFVETLKYELCYVSGSAYELNALKYAFKAGIAQYNDD
jgi:hypothetical protein